MESDTHAPPARPGHYILDHFFKNSGKKRIDPRLHDTHETYDKKKLFYYENLKNGFSELY